MDKFARVDKNLFRGAVPTEMELSILKDIWGVRNIVSLDQEQGNKVAPFCKKLGLHHDIIPLTDGNNPNVILLTSSTIPFLLDNGPSYVHCRHGKDRTGMAVAMYRVCRGWPLYRALHEANDFGMGHGLQPHVHRSYYDAVCRFAQAMQHGDQNGAIDIVQKERESLMSPHEPPSGRQDIPSSSRHSWAPFRDPDGERLSRPASKRVYRKCQSKDLLKPKQMWTNSPGSAQGSGTLYSAIISSNAKAEKYKRDYSKTLMQAALVKEPEVIQFLSGTYVVDPDALVDIKEEDDKNDIVESGLIQGYEGPGAMNVFPGSSGYGYDGGATGAGGYGALGNAGFIFGPHKDF